MTPPVRVAIADDHALFRQGVRAMFATVDDVELVDEAEDGDDAIRVAVTSAPDVLLLDVRMPRRSGVDAIRAIRSRAPGVRIVMLTMVEADEALAVALRDGAVGYVLKGADPDELIRVVHAAARGELLFGASVAHRAAALLHPAAGPWHPPLPELRDREREVLDLLAAGHEPAEIARRLHVSVKTVRNVLAGIPARLGVATRGEAVDLARRAGLGRGA
ncbi:response regulator [Agromyces marinus]|uniref:DNA-binding response regulator n=1 Tax=Agromyces marinus TaxID=1389020 RepID=A0ABN6YEW7_9MICO|nr:response regulator transcription factor [Agromyces marinus]UIP59289.1 Oxygen regulatory protein NreC [Agromyces marinus]BDZ55691.1 DNA-binding response regulator [Agromyces marinus]